MGFVLPGETAAILGGVAASRGTVSLTLMCTVVVLAAIVGDSVGYEIGARYGTPLVEIRVFERRRERIDGARATLARRGGPALFGGRFVAFLRTMLPFLAGTSHTPYSRLLVYNAAGGLIWGVGAVRLGYLVGHSYAAVERTFGRVTAVLAGALVVVGLLIWRIRRHRRQSVARPDTGPSRTDPD